MEKLSDEVWSQVYGSDYLALKELVSTENIDLKDRDGRSLLFHAVLAKRPDFVIWLMEQHADANMRDNAGRTALQYAEEDRYVDIVAILIAHGADAGTGV